MNNRLLEKTTSFQRAIDIPSPDEVAPTTTVDLFNDVTVFSGLVQLMVTLEWGLAG